MLTSIVYLYLLLFFMIKIMYGEGNMCSCTPPASSFTTGVNLIYYKCNNETPATISYPITAPEKLLNVLEDKQTIFYIFGFLQNPEKENVQSMMNALCYGGTNVVLLDWSKYSSSINYWKDFEEAQKVGSAFAQSLQKLVDNGLKVSNIYIIGFSLGAHIAGLAGKCTKFKIPRITGLDPANPAFYPSGCYLTSTDATKVDVIHTDMGGFGTPTSMGTAEYYANGGYRPQPNFFCSHIRSVELFIASIYNPTEFSAISCSSCDLYKADKCSSNNTTNVGYSASNTSGFYYFHAGTYKVRCKLCQDFLQSVLKSILDKFWNSFFNPLTVIDAIWRRK
ncbi:pancreatic triacylglycerol lipase-like isoform X2 [Anoplolepis gracilipes]|uniref:pancreatic triacylglycerol lipase-like isoform X2 n=1 Tax=Anoplolepis gracilipes TaxID=354296 RepID=UPI003BA28F3C